MSIRNVSKYSHTHSKILLLLQQKIIAKKCDFSFAYLPCCSPLDHSVQKDLKFDKKKDVNEIVIKKNIEKKTSTEIFECARASARCSSLLQREVDAVIPKKNNELVARHSLHADRVLARARTL